MRRASVQFAASLMRSSSWTPDRPIRSPGSPLARCHQMLGEIPPPCPPALKGSLDPDDAELLFRTAHRGFGQPAERRPARRISAGPAVCRSIRASTATSPATWPCSPRSGVIMADMHGQVAGSRPHDRRGFRPTASWRRKAGVLPSARFRGLENVCGGLRITSHGARISSGRFSFARSAVRSLS